MHSLERNAFLAKAHVGEITFGRYYLPLRMIALSTVLGSLACAPAAARAVDVVTYHYDNLRTGWNQNETILTPSNVSGSTFGQIFSAHVDAEPTPQPLVATGVHIAGGKHDVVYVATTNNSVYAFDAVSGSRLVSVNLGAPPPRSVLPKPANTGITSTPVMDVNAGLLYVLTCTYENSTPTYRLHALDVGTLQDTLPSQVVVASGQLSDGSAVQFQAAVQRQRPALLLANGNIYAAFGSFGDLAGDVTRGWLLGWNASNLSPLPANELTNQQASSPGDCQHNGTGPCFLTSIWMSGFGPAADKQGNIYFVTGNSDAGSYSPPLDVQESAVKVTGSLDSLLDYFTPYQQVGWDEHDTDFGSGGITLLPQQPGAIPNMAVAAGKSGKMYLLNRDNMGKHVTSPPDNVVAIVTAERCWCGESYFQGSDGVGRVVSSGGNQVMVWKIVTSPQVSLVQEAVSGPLPSGQDQGFLTSVSSNGTTAGSAIVWAVGRPETSGGAVTLIAIDPTDGSTLFSAPIGSWLRGDENANLVPVVANGRVYVDVDSNLFAFGLGGKKVARVAAVNAEPRVESNEVHGKIVSMDGTRIVLRTRSGTELAVDGSDAAKAHRSAPVFVGNAMAADGYYDSGHVFHATLIFRAKDSPALWPTDK
jgi:outer membrane protein assembly factor BamB